jgi:hypothetical protein
MFHNKCKCECEYNVIKAQSASFDYTKRMVESITSVLIEAGILIETDALIKMVYHDDKKYTVKKVK